MKNFSGFFRRAMIVQPDDAELMRRSEKRTVEDGLYFVMILGQLSHSSDLLLLVCVCRHLSTIEHF